jgi:hypothetical protein
MRVSRGSASLCLHRLGVHCRADGSRQACLWRHHQHRRVGEVKCWLRLLLPQPARVYRRLSRGEGATSQTISSLGGVGVRERTFGSTAPRLPRAGVARRGDDNCRLLACGRTAVSRSDAGRRDILDRNCGYHCGGSFDDVAQCLLWIAFRTQVGHLLRSEFANSRHHA